MGDDTGKWWRGSDRGGEKGREEGANSKVWFSVGKPFGTERVGDGMSREGARRDAVRRAYSCIESGQGADI